MTSGVTAPMVITGAAGGLGRVIVDRFAGERAIVALDRDREAIEAGRAARDLPNIRWMAGDICDGEAARRAIDDAANDLGRPLTLIHCASALPVRKAALEITNEEFIRAMDVGVVGALNCIRAVFPAMRSARWGRIVCISSVMGSGGWRLRAEYAASKAALESVCATLAVELGSYGVTVNCIAPGHMKTAATANAAIPWDAIVARTALGRPVTTSDIAATVGFLVDEAAGGMTGTVTTVDAGYLVNRFVE